MECRSCVTLAVAAAAIAALQPLHATAQSAVQTARIAEIAGRTTVQRAFRAIDELEATTIANHVMLTEIASPPFMEERRAAKFAELLREAGADSVWIDAEGNVIALRRVIDKGRSACFFFI